MARAGNPPVKAICFDDSNLWITNSLGVITDEEDWIFDSCYLLFIRLRWW